MRFRQTLLASDAPHHYSPPVTEPSDPLRKVGDELRAAGRLAIDATKRITHVVQDMHHAIGAGPALLGKPLEPLFKLFSAPVYASIRGVTDLVGVGLDRVLMEMDPLLDAHTPSSQYDAVRAAINGVIGDELAANENPLAIPTTLALRGRPLPPERAALLALAPELGDTATPSARRLLVLVHGSSMDDGAWLRGGHHHGEVLARELGLVPVTVRYNSGRHVSINGRELARQLEALVRAWPQPVESVTVVGFSMGGLVARAAVHTAEADALSWRGKLSAMVFLGTPHHGAPLERAGNLVGGLLDLTPYTAPLAGLAQIRSAGITDLRHGNVLDAHWEGLDRFAPPKGPRAPAPLPVGVPCFAIAGRIREHADGIGDGLVPVESALGQHADRSLALGIPPERTAVVPGHKHLDLLSSPSVGAQVRDWLAPLM